MIPIEKPDTMCVSATISDEDIREIWIYALGEFGFHGFEEAKEEVHAFIDEALWDEGELRKYLSEYFPEMEVSFVISRVEAKNWNEEWEKNYPNLYIGAFCQVLPSFREPLPGFLHTIIIDPKMSFGTGHHATTQLMMFFLQEVDCKEKAVMDMGCGTGILGILASMLGAQFVTGIDIDPWCVENSIENIELNFITNMAILQGGAEAIPEKQYDIFIANINRNILLADGEKYVKHLSEGGKLLLSGFYEADIRDIRCHFEALELNFEALKTRNNWAGLCFSARKR